MLFQVYIKPYLALYEIYKVSAFQLGVGFTQKRQKIMDTRFKVISRCIKHLFVKI